MPVAPISEADGAGGTDTHEAERDEQHCQRAQREPDGGALGAPVLKAIWRRNLKRLKSLVEEA